MRIWLTLVCLLLGSVIAHAESDAKLTYAATPPTWASVPKPELPKLAKGGPDNSTIPLHPLDDPANPFAGKYDATDRWAYEHYIPYPSQDEVQQYALSWQDDNFRRQFPEHWMFTTARVDANGWMVPHQ